MRFDDIIGDILKLESPWEIERSEVLHTTKTVKIYIGYQRGSRFTCPKCCRSCKVHDGRWREWRHLDVMDYYCYLHIKVPRPSCGEHGVPTYNRIPYARNGSHYSFGLERHIMDLAKDMSVSSLSRELNEPDTNLRRVIKHYIAQGRKRLDRFDARHVAVDEKSYKQGHKYVTVFSDMDTGCPIFVCKGRDEKVFGQFYGGPYGMNGDPHKIELVSMDMAKSYISGKRIYFGHAREIFDRFHIKKAPNHAVDLVRREEAKDIEALKKTRYIWSENPDKLTQKQDGMPKGFLEDASLKTARAYQFKTAFDQLWGVHADKVENVLHAWMEEVANAGIRQLINFKNMVKNHMEGIRNSFKSNMTNAVAEGINSTVQLTKFRARGFRNVDNFIDMIFLVKGNLKYQFHH